MYIIKYIQGVLFMDTISYTSFRQNLAGLLDKVNEDHAPIMITRQNGDPAIVMSVQDFKSYEETAYLMASPKNAQRLNQAISEIDKETHTEHGLIEE